MTQICELSVIHAKLHTVLFCLLLLPSFLSLHLSSLLSFCPSLSFDSLSLICSQDGVRDYI